MEYKTYIDKVSLVREKTEILKFKIRQSSDIVEFIRPIYAKTIDIYESMYSVYLNRNNAIMSYSMISQGGMFGTVIDVRLIIKYALDTLASGVILIHNHPSGNLNPSEADISITRKANESLKIMDLKLFDHIIISSNYYYSFADEGRL
jgi:DNA repair protein RadC